MGLVLNYKNELGTVVMQGTGKGAVRICRLAGLGVLMREYNVASHWGQSGQTTLSSRALPRTITMTLEVSGRNSAAVLRETLRVLSREGMLYIQNGGTARRIYCNQVQIPDMEWVLKGEISTFAVQLVCDNPYFEDGEDILQPLYQRVKRLETPFSLPCMFGEITTQTQICITGEFSVEPQITLYYPKRIGSEENITICNLTTGKSICLDYSPKDDDRVEIDVKSRKITSSKSGNLLNHLSDSTFLGDFVFEKGANLIDISQGDVTAGFTVECRYVNLYQEAVSI